jgi:hypothetical protein
MKLPFAVYTARQGYAWQSGLDHGKEKLERFRRVIGKMPEFDFAEPACRGIVNVQDTVVAYRFMRQTKADSAGRDAAYLAITFFSRDQARFIDADALFAGFPFCDPLQQPPSAFVYKGGPAIPGDFTIPSRSASGCFSSGGDLSSAGFVFSQAFPGTLKVHIQETPQPKALFEYALAAPQQAPVSAPAAPRPEVSSLNESFSSAPVVIHSDFWKAVSIVAVAVALIEAAIMAWFLWCSFDRQQPHAPIEQAEPAVIPESIEKPAASAHIKENAVGKSESDKKPAAPAPDHSPEQASPPEEGAHHE